MEKAASGASGTCGNFVRKPVIMRTFLVKHPLLLTEDGGGGRRVVNGKLRSDKGYLR